MLSSSFLSPLPHHLAAFLQELSYRRHAFYPTETSLLQGNPTFGLCKPCLSSPKFTRQITQSHNYIHTCIVLSLIHSYLEPSEVVACTKWPGRQRLDGKLWFYCLNWHPVHRFFFGFFQADCVFLLVLKAVNESG